MGPRALLKRYLFEGDILRLMAWTSLVKPVGLVTQMFSARYFGAGLQYDAYALALFLVQFLNNLVGSSFNSVFLPLAIKRRTTMSKSDFNRFQNLALFVFIAPVSLYMIVLLVRGNWVMGLMAPDLPAETRVYVDRMLPWMIAPGLALMIASMLKSVLNQNRRFGVSGAMPVLVGLVGLIILVATQKHIGIWSLPLGFGAGNLIQLGVLAVFAHMIGCLAWARPAAPPEARRELGSLGGVFMLSQLVMTIGMAVDRYFASGLEVGSVSSLAYSNTILNLGIQLFSFSLTAVMFTRMSEYISAGDMMSCQRYLHDNLTRQSRLIVPISLGLAVASPEVVRVLFQRGEFGPDDAMRTSGVLTFHLLGLPAVVTNNLIARVYYSLQRLHSRIWLNIQYVATLVLCSYLLVKPLRVMGLAVSATIAINLHLALCLFVLHRFRTGLNTGSLTMVLVRNYLLAGLAFGAYAASGIANRLDSRAAHDSLIGAIAGGALKLTFICAVYYAGYYAWRVLQHSRAART